jgi:UPF0716 protein FxsA
MRLALVAILLGFPLVEIGLLVHLAETHGWWVLGWVVLAACAGFALLKEARFALVARIGAAISVGRFPIAAFVDSARTVIAGLFLIFPGLISDFIALTLLLLPRSALPEPAPARAFGNVVDGQFRRER